MNNNIIAEILNGLFYENKRISIGRLGFFEITHQSASYNPQTKTFFPPSDFLQFINIETTNDNILTGKIAESFGISQDAANEKITEWIDEICINIAETGRSDLGKYGTFYVNKEGKIVFSFGDGTNELKNNFGLKNIEFK